MAPNTDLSTRAAIVTLKSPFGGKSTAQISTITGIPQRTINEIYRRACRRGFDPNASIIKILPEYLEDAPRAGRPRKREAVQEATPEKSPQRSEEQAHEANKHACIDEEDEV
ncbi:hypothetical protein COCC4DRAFT_200398 [Bipolaris maydis ATCC 48331]|uniref:Uncharacterized protein n=2 Tax=Cochliobolus heterostrophus TaxID=5016 RepID=M2U1U8_COCH5|nr:uncharacterized protein COCC4DRAFT_200398 [Bipolaris maydis ATCC 48331]EMD88011.1 hypothetical protein COCHEDRAFT_1227264 [Bipolaris maydis C5]ENI03526.1 hypothetical protein COCC4DRAFT_200398 [Bipolaris maydis ATCC 48331]KAH7552238.1 hypothetical protein BM1_09100 [Bipolaris maydis]